MSIRSLVMSKPGMAKAFMSHAPESLHTKSGKRYAARAVEEAVTRTRAYPAFLREHGIDASKALEPKAFETLPFTSKKDYVARYALDELTLDSKLSCGYTIEKSSGYSGACHYWFRTPQEDAMYPAYMEFAFRQFYRINERSTLVIIALAMGTWTSGEKMAQAMRQVAATGKYSLTVTSPGINREEILETVRDISPYFDQTVIVGYPPFVKEVIDVGIGSGIDWPSLSVRLGLGGEGYSEEWRRNVAAKLGVDTSRDLMAVSGGYGAADLGMSVGREYPLTVLVRQLAEADEGLARDLFGGTEVPNLFQYSPSNCYIEEAESELVFTVSSGIPLVRYRIGDRGGILGFERLISVLASHGYDAHGRLAELGYDAGDVWKLPLFYCLGRSDGAVFVGGLNVYPENVGAALTAVDDPDVLGFKLATTESGDDGPDRLMVMLEHRGPELAGDEAVALAGKWTRLVGDGLARVNREYRRLRDASPHLAEPVVKVFAEGRGPFATDAGKIKRKYIA